MSNTLRSALRKIWGAYQAKLGFLLTPKEYREVKEFIGAEDAPGTY